VEKAGRELLARPARQAPLLPGADVVAFIDIDSAQKRVYGHTRPPGTGWPGSLASGAGTARPRSCATRSWRTGAGCSARTTQTSCPPGTRLARMLGPQGRYADAEPMFCRCSRPTRRVLGAEHPDSRPPSTGSAGRKGVLPPRRREEPERTRMELTVKIMPRVAARVARPASSSFHL
jgi:hypothetical protein